MNEGPRDHRNIDVGDGLVLHVEISGSGPPVVLLHGFTGSTETWKGLCPELSEFHVVLVDLPGHGRSSSPSDPSRYRLDRFTSDLATLLDRLDLKRVVMAGYSMGARAALKFAVAHAERVAGLVLESTSPGLSNAALRVQRTTADNELADMIERSGVVAFVDHWERLSLWESQANLSAEVRSSLRAQRLGGNAVGLSNSLRGAGAGIDPPMHSRLHEVTAPTLLIAGELDSTYADHARVLAEGIPDARLCLIANAGHAVHLEQPGALSSVLTGFLSSLPHSPQAWL